MDFLPMVFQIVGFAIGGPAGAMIGSFIGAALFGTMSGSQEGPRLKDLKVQSSAFGQPLPITYGSVRLAGNIIWSPGIKENKNTETVGGGLFGGGQDITTYKYFVSLAIGLCEGEIDYVRRVWANSTLIYDAREFGSLSRAKGFDMTVYTGSEVQTADPYIADNLNGYGVPAGDDGVPAYRGTAYVVIKDFALELYGNSVPQFEFEIIRGTQSQDAQYGRLAVDPANGGFFSYWSTHLFRPRDAKLYGWVSGAERIYDVDLDKFKVVYGHPTPYGGNLSLTLSQTAGGGFVATRNNPSILQETEYIEHSGFNRPPVSGDPGYNIDDNAFWYAGPASIDGQGRKLCHGINGIAGPRIYRQRGTGEWDWIASNPGLCYGSIGESSGIPLSRATQEAGDNIPRTSIQWDFRWGRIDTTHIWCRFTNSGHTEVDSNGAPIDSSIDVSGGLSSDALQTYGGGQNGVALAHDKTRDRVFYRYWNGASHTLLIHDLCVSAGYAWGYRPIAVPIASQTAGSASLSISYNEEMDWLVLVGNLGGTPATTRIVCYPCHPQGVAALEAGTAEPDFTIDVTMGSGHYVKNAHLYEAVSRNNYVVVPGEGNNVIYKFEFDVGMDAEPVPLWYIVQDICLRAGLDETDLDVTELTDLVQGYAVARTSTARAAIEPLMQAYFFDAVETGGDDTE